jgi:hypothetical protein
MAKKTAVTVEVVSEDVLQDLKGTGAEVALVSTPKQLIALVEAGEVAVIPTNRLVPLYIVLDAMAKRIAKLLEKIKDKEEKSYGLQMRREEGSPTGDKNQHRLFEYPGLGQLTIQEKRSWRPNPEKLETLLKKKKLWDAAVDLRITTCGDLFQKFLWKNRKQLRDMGVEIVEEVNSDKVDGLCLAQLISPSELEAILDKPDPTYALLPKLLK